MNKELTVGFYNVENFFDIYDDPTTFDDDFTENGKKKWRKGRYENKLHKINHAINLLSNKDNELSLFVGLCEVENELVLTDLLNKGNLHNHFKFIHYDSKDERGIDVALLYDYKSIKIKDSKVYNIPLKTKEGLDDFTRDILYVSTDFKELNIHVFVVHLPSKRNNDVNKETRIIIIKELKNHIDILLSKFSNPAIIILGDFNENANDTNLVSLLDVISNKDNMKDGQLLNLFINNFENKEFSAFFHQEGLLFDQILVSKYFTLPNSDLFIESSDVINAHSLEEWKEKYKNKPFRTYVENKYLGGYSDHYPVRITFKVNSHENY